MALSIARGVAYLHTDIQKGGKYTTLVFRKLTMKYVDICWQLTTTCLVFSIQFLIMIIKEDNLLEKHIYMYNSYPQMN